MNEPTQARRAEAPGQRSSAFGTFAAALAVARKELGEGFRDRQTLIYTFVLPVCMYPALFWVMVQGVLIVQGQKGARDVVVAIAAPAEIYAQAAEAVGKTPEGGGGAVRVEALEGADTGDVDALRELVRSGEGSAPDAILVLPADVSGAERAELYFDSTTSRSSTARDRVKRSLESWSTDLREAAAAGASPPIDPEVLDPILVQTRSVAEKKDEGALVLSLMLPMLLVVMSVLGAFFPAVDVTAGEKERGTAETTLLLPVPRTSVHLGKILAVCASAMIATVLNLLALALSAGHLLQQLSAASSESIPVELPIGALVSIMPLAALFAFFVSASLTGVASLAASFKEGQALLGPVQMVFIFPAVAASLPGLTLDQGTAWIPVVNVALAFRGMLVGDVAASALLSCALSLVLCAAFAIWFSVRLRSNEQVALSGETLSLRRLVSLLRSPRSAS